MTVARRGWTTKPPMGARLDLGHPLATGLVYAALMNEGGGLSVLDGTARRGPGTLTNGVSRVATVRGLGLSFDGSNDYVAIDSKLISGSYWSMATLINPSRYGTDDFGNAIFYQGTGSSDLGTVVCVGTGPSVGVTNGLFARHAGGALGVSSDSAITLNIFQSVVFTFAAGAGAFYVDGVPRGTPSGMGAATPANNAFIGFWYLSSDAARFFQGSMVYQYVWERVLAAGEVLALHVNPYAFVAAPSPRLLVNLPAAATTAAPRIVPPWRWPPRASWQWR